MNFSLFEQDLKHVWQKANHCLPELRNSRIFVTGGTGFFGHWLLESVAYANQFFDTNIQVVVLTRNVKAFLHQSPQFTYLPWLSFLEGDIRNFTVRFDNFTDVRNFAFPFDDFTHVIHAATEASAALNKNNPLLMLETIIEGTRRVLEFSTKVRAKHFLLISSGAIYGCQPTSLEKIPESYIGTADPLNPASAYAIGKLTAEHLTMLYSKHLLYSKHFELNVKIARCFAFVGPYLPLTTHFAMGNFIANAINQEPIYISGDGSPYRSYLYAADLVVWLWSILCFGASGLAYNVGSDQAISIADLATLIAQQTGLPVNRSKEPNPHIPAERYVPDTQRANIELNLYRWIELPEAIRRTIAWHESRASSKIRIFYNSASADAK